ncbi:MAG: hypothetical protein IBX61_03400 [Thermoleophilia bacterium]|nr:hypothetical protein [Thermoleophilia bacterium]
MIKRLAKIAIPCRKSQTLFPFMEIFTLSPKGFFIHQYYTVYGFQFRTETSEHFVKVRQDSADKNYMFMAKLDFSMPGYAQNSANIQ